MNTYIIIAGIIIAATLTAIHILHRARYRSIPKETYLALSMLSETYVFVTIIDLEANEAKIVKSTPFADSLINPNDPIRERIHNVFKKAVSEEFRERMEEFGDISTICERLSDRRSVSMQYMSTAEGIGWSLASFIAAERGRDNELCKIILTIQSINESKQKEHEYEEALSRAYRNENAILGELIRMQAVGVLASDSSSKIIVANDALLEMFDRSGTDPIGMNVFDFWSESPVRTPVEAMNKYDEIEARGGSFTYQMVVCREGKEKQMRYLMADAKRVDLLDGTKVMVTCVSDITSGKLLEDKLRTLSETDALTNIANRRCGESQIRLLMQEGIPGLFCLFDVNGFKQINDTYGHQTGDDTLVAVAKAVRASFRSEDIFMRLGGDEFAIYMKNVTTPELAKIRIARLFENIARIELENIPRGSVTISLGAVVATAHNGVIDEEYESVYKRADAQMYKCKGRPGSNRSIDIPTERNEDEESQTSS